MLGELARRAWRRCWPWVLLALLLLLPQAALAEGAGVVALIVEADHPSLPVLRAELRAMGLQVRGPGVDADPEHAEFIVSVSGREVRVEVLDTESSSVLRRQRFLDPDGSALHSLTSVIQTVEFIRWHLEHPNTPFPTSEPPLAAEPTAKTEPPSPPAQPWGWVLATGPTLTYSPGGLAAGLGVQIQAGYAGSLPLGVRVTGGASLLPFGLSDAAGQVEASLLRGGAQLFGVLSQPGAGFRGELGLGFSLVSMSLLGLPSTGYEGRSEGIVTGAPALDLGLGYHFGRGLSLLSTWSAVVPLESRRILIDDQVVGDFGRVLLSVGLALQLHSP